jgi:hypothetical protein
MDKTRTSEYVIFIHDLEMSGKLVRISQKDERGRHPEICAEVEISWEEKSGMSTN